jgi:RNA ligase (TIGR02306 family)
MGVDTHKVEVVPVVLLPHPNADKLSIVKVYNFTVVVNTADWQGVTQAAYAQPDSVMPDTPEYRFLKETGNIRKERDELRAAMEAEHESDLARLDYEEKLRALEARVDSNTKYLRIAVRKLRGVISMGMLLPIPKCQLCIDDLRTGTFSGAPTLRGKYHELGTEFRTICTDRVEIGDDVAVALGITHYEPPTMDEIEGSRRHAGDDVAAAPQGIYAPKYDVESVYKYADCFEAGEMVYVSEKLDGQNARYVSTLGPRYKETSPGGGVKMLEDYTFHVGSREEWKKKEGNSNWWRAVEQNPWIQEWMISNPERVMYGEVFGWVAPLKYGAKQGQLFFRAFDILDGMEYIDAEQFIAEVPEEQRAPSFGIMPFDFEKLQALADGQSLIKGANHMREGIVIKPLKERKHWKLGRVMLKMVSNAYLEKSAR